MLKKCKGLEKKCSRLEKLLAYSKQEKRYYKNRLQSITELVNRNPFDDNSSDDDEKVVIIILFSICLSNCTIGGIQLMYGLLFN